MEKREFTLEDFNYEVPKELIAQEPVLPRDAARLLVLRGNSIEHRTFRDIVDYVSRGDVIVINNTRVIPARFSGKKESGGKAEALLIRIRSDGSWEAIVSGKNIKKGSRLFFGKFSAEVLEKEEGRFFLRFDVEPEKLISSGEIPLPHYIKKMPENPEMYQTVYSRREGAIAAPTAGLHFTPELIEKIKSKGVKFVEITLHVGLGTFRPVKDMATHRMDPEFYEVREEAALEINNAAKSGHRIFAVGTTVLKTLETVSKGGIVNAGCGESSLFIKPGHIFQSPVSALITNFHIPKSTLIMLVTAFSGYDEVMTAYREAVQHRYRFFSFGDAMLLYKKAEMP